jgi:glycolate oxidase FAD binding subunit
LPADRFGSDADRTWFAVDGLVPNTVIYPESTSEVQAAVRAAATAGLALLPAGCGAHLGIGMPPRRLDCVISTARLARVVDHAAADMTVTVEAGATLAQLGTVLAGAGQWLPLDPPLPTTTSIGGLIAANLSGPLRLSQGSVRDLLTGLRAVRADGTLISSGGRVVKNVAGYDLHKAFIGAYGTLGMVVEATFRVRPVPEIETAVVAACGSPDDAMRLVGALRDALVEPLWIAVASRAVIDGSTAQGRAAVDGGLLVATGLGGIAASVAAQRDRVAAIVRSEAGRTLWDTNDVDLSSQPPSTLYDALRDLPATLEAEAVCTVSLLPGDLAEYMRTAAREIEQQGIGVCFVAHGAVATLHVLLGNNRRPCRPHVLVDLIPRLRTLATERGGHLILRRGTPEVKRATSVWGDVGPTAFLMERLKRTFDPTGLWSAGRFVGGL